MKDAANVKERTQRAAPDAQGPVSGTVARNAQVSTIWRSPSTRRLLEDALSGNRAAMKILFATLQPVIRARAERLLQTYSRKRNTRHYELDEITQDIWVALLDDDARALRGYAPERGMGLLGYVGLIAERTVISMLRGRREEGQAVFLNAEEETATLAAFEQDTCPESKFTRNQAGRLLLQELRASLGEKGSQILELSIVQGRPLDEVCASLQMSEEAVYAWRSRILKRAEALLHEVSPNGHADG